MLKIAFAAATLVFAAPAFAQLLPPQQEQQQLAAAPAEFVAQAASMGMSEVAKGQLGVQRAQSPQIQEYARSIIEDHSRNNQALMNAATQAGVPVPAEPQPQDQQAVQQLSGLSGADFDRAFMDQMVQDHSKAVQLYQRQAQAGQTPELQAYARQTLPVLQQHLEHAQAMAARQRG